MLNEGIFISYDFIFFLTVIPSLVIKNCLVILINFLYLIQFKYLFHPTIPPTINYFNYKFNQLYQLFYFINLSINPLNYY